jgi:hypothetical protein
MPRPFRCTLHGLRFGHECLGCTWASTVDLAGVCAGSAVVEKEFNGIAPNQFKNVAALGVR